MRGDTRKFDSVARKGGHSTYRLFLQGDRTIHDEQFRSLWGTIQELRATFENANDHFVSVDIPPSADVAKVYELLQQGEKQGVWAFEEANYEGKSAQE